MQTKQHIKVWDLPVRLFHWGAVACFLVSWASASWFDNAMEIHLYSGYAMLTLVLFRIIWGFAGSTTARFSNFVRDPRSLAAYARTLRHRAPSLYLGHNPGGGWAVVIMLALLLFQVLTGLFSTDDSGSVRGPLAHLISDDASDTISTIHSVAFDFLIAVIGIHIAAVFFYRIFKHDNLITAMINGTRNIIPGMTIPELRFAGLRRAAIIFILVAVTVIVLIRFN